MDKYRIQIIIFIICLLGTLNINAQRNDSLPNIKVIARPTKNSIMLRWAPTSAVAWKYLNNYGYKVERYTISKKGIINSVPGKKILTSDPYKPWNLDKWKKMIDSSDVAAIVAQAIYGESFEICSESDNVAKLVNRSKDLESRYSFALYSVNQSRLVAEASGLFFNDTTARPDEHYLYRVLSLVPKNTESIDSGYVYTGIEDYQPLPKPIIKSIAISDKNALITWDRMHFDNIFNNYIIERSVDSCKTFKSLTNVPFVNMSDNMDDHAQYYTKTDSVPQTGQRYYYRIKGVSMFGETSPPSDTMSGFSLGKLKYRPIIQKSEITTNGQVNIKWEFPKEGIKEIKGFNILRSGKAANGFIKLNKELIKPEFYEFIDLKPNTTNYYKIEAIGKSEGTTESFAHLVQPEDSIPPAPPKGLSGTVDSLGSVIVKWTSNTEEDMKGYLVFRANYANEEFAQITSQSTPNNIYHDSIPIRTLTRKIYYKIKAIDRHFNQSEFSEALAIERPDVIPPQSPVFTNYKVDNKGVTLSFQKSCSNDVARHLLYRRDAGQKQWNLIAQFIEPDSTIMYNDISGGKQREFEYTMIAIDSSKLESLPAKSLKVKLLNSERPAIIKVYGKSVNIPRATEISWVYNEGPLVRFTLYRSVNDLPLVTYRSVPGNERKFTDKQVELGKTYNYYIKAIFADGTESPVSLKITVRF